MNKFTESVADVMRYIAQVEMGGHVDPKNHLYPTYLDLRDIFEEVKDHNETLDLESHSVLTNKTDDSERYYWHPEEVFNRKWCESNN